MFPQEINCIFTKLLLLKFPYMCSPGDYFILHIHDYCTLFSYPVFFPFKHFNFKRNISLFLTRIMIKSSITSETYRSIFA